MPPAPSYPSLTMQMLGMLLRPCHSRQLLRFSAQTLSLSMNRACMCNANISYCLFVLRQPVLWSYRVRLDICPDCCAVLIQPKIRSSSVPAMACLQYSNVPPPPPPPAPLHGPLMLFSITLTARASDAHFALICSPLHLPLFVFLSTKIMSGAMHSGIGKKHLLHGQVRLLADMVGVVQG